MADRRRYVPRPVSHSERPDSWIDHEPGIVDGISETFRLLGRALRRPLTVLSITLALALLLGGFGLVKKWLHAPRFVLRAVETDYNPATSPRPKRKLRDYVHQAVFTHSRLLELIKKHGLYPSLTRKNPHGAVESFREDIEVDVYRNYFVVERSAHEPPRSARISIRYKSEDPRQALAVTRDLGRMIIDNENNAARERAEAVRQQAAEEVARTQQQVVDVRQRLAAATQRWASTAGPDSSSLAVEVMKLTAQLRSLDERRELAERRKVQLDLGAALVENDLGLRFEVVDEGAVSSSDKEKKTVAVTLALSGFFGLFPFVMLTVAAFDGRIRNLDDLRRLGLPLLGHVRTPVSPLQRTTPVWFSPAADFRDEPAGRDSDPVAARPSGVVPSNTSLRGFA